MQSYILLYRIALNNLSIILYAFEEIANRMLLASIQGFVCAYCCTCKNRDYTHSVRQQYGVWVCGVCACVSVCVSAQDTACISSVSDLSLGGCVQGHV